MPERAYRSIAAVVLAAGKGKRLKSRAPKVLHPLCGRPALWHVLRAAADTKPDRIVVVVHNDADRVRTEVSSWGLRPEPVFVEQSETLGTGHAVMVAEDALGDATEVLVIPGDEPLHTGPELRDLLKARRSKKAAATLLITELHDPSGYGRIIRDEDEFVRIVQERDASSLERRIKEVATSVYAFSREGLFDALRLIGNDNRQREYYLPDVLLVLKDKGEDVGVMPSDSGGVLGINTREELAEVTAVMRRRLNDQHMAAGVTFLDPEHTFVDAEVKIGADTVLYPTTFLEGTTRIGSGCVVGPATRIVDSRIGDGSEVQFSVIVGSRVGRRVAVGPYASLRPGTAIADDAKAGTFVEIKASRVGKRTKVPHLSYVGDTTIGKDTNIGAATITVNYDGWDKYRTVIGDDVRIGSDTMLVAPVRVGKRAMTGAGSVITRDVPPGALAIERSEQRTVKGFRDRKEAQKAKRRRSTGRSGGH